MELILSKELFIIFNKGFVTLIKTTVKCIHFLWKNVKEFLAC